MTSSLDSCDDGKQRTLVQPVELVADLWLIIMSLLSPSDVIRLSLVSDSTVMTHTEYNLITGSDM